MPIEIKMPALSPTMTEGNLAKWLKKEGDRVEPGQVIAEIETDKATMEVEAIEEGTLGRILVPEGSEGVAVNTPIALLLEEGEDEAALERAKPEAPRSETKPEAPKAEARPPEPKPRPAAARGNGEAAEERVFASPLARRMAQQAGLDLERLEGSGPHGRIVKADIERALEKGVPEKPARPEPAKAPPPAAMGPVGEAYDEVKLSNMRKIIARRMSEAKQTVPHFYLSMDVELDALLKLRQQLNGREGADYRLSVNDFLIKASALALRRKPEANVSFGGDKAYRYHDVDVAVAVAIPDGLITPIVRRADQKGLATISKEMKDLAERAREGKLKPEEYQGGTFSLSNLGMYDVKHFEAIINPPQACILAVGAGEKRPVVKNDALAIATVMTLTLSVDHRVVDGAIGAELLRELKRIVEDPIAMML